MPTDRDPGPPHHDGDDIVKLKGGYCGAPAHCSANNPRTIFAPHEVAGPLLAARIEQGCAAACMRVPCVSLHPFEAVAHAASKPKVFLKVCATLSLRNNVIYF